MPDVTILLGGAVALSLVYVLVFRAPPPQPEDLRAEESDADLYD